MSENRALQNIKNPEWVIRTFNIVGMAALGIAALAYLYGVIVKNNSDSLGSVLVLLAILNPPGFIGG